MEANAVIHPQARLDAEASGQTRRGLAVRLSVTERCQLRCTYCMPEKGCGCSRENLRELSHHQLVSLLSAIHGSHGIRRLRFTGGEPLLRNDLEELISSVRALGIEDLSLTTNAQLLAERAAGLRQAGIRRLNVSLDSVRPETFHAMTRGGHLDRVLAGLEAAHRVGLGPVKLNMVVIRGANDQEVDEVLEHAIRSGCQLRYLELMPIGAGGSHFEKDFVSSADVRDHLARKGYQLTPLPWDGHETSRDWEVRTPGGQKASCGFISPTSQPFCDGCRRMRITSDGWLYGCLARNIRHDLRPVLDETGASHAIGHAGEIVEESFRSKNGEKYRQAIPSMSMIGG
jgi:cyclic pyranopterin phosphate synthase